MIDCSQRGIEMKNIVCAEIIECDITKNSLGIDISLSTPFY